MVRFVSLGGDCQPAQQILHNGGVEKHIFDWLIAPVRSVENLIRTNFERFLEPADLIVDQDATRLYRVINRHNDIQFLHDFKVFDQDNISRVQAKYSYLISKFTDLLGKPVGESPYFVRRWHVCDGAEDETSARSLHTALMQKNPKSRLLYLHSDASRLPIVAGSYRSMYLPQDTKGWEGDHAAWTSLLTKFALHDLPQTGFPDDRSSKPCQAEIITEKR